MGILLSKKAPISIVQKFEKKNLKEIKLKKRKKRKKESLPVEKSRDE